MEEGKVGVIPRVVVQGMLGPKEYGILLTTQRLIFVLETSSKAAVGYVIGGIVGSVIADSFGSKNAIDYSNESIEKLTADKKNMKVPYTSIRRILVKKKLSGYNLRIECEREGNKGKIVANIAPPDMHIQQKRAEGKESKEIIREYAENVWKAFEKALPPEVAQKIEVEM